MADPPYTEEFAKNLYNCDYPIWSKWTKELVRVVKPQGRIGIMQNYIVPRLPNCDMDEIIVILLRIKQYPKMVTVQKAMNICLLFPKVHIFYKSLYLACHLVCCILAHN